MHKKLLRTKAIVDHSGSGLKKCLTAFDLALLGIGCAIGTGIFVLTGIAAATQSGPAVVPVSYTHLDVYKRQPQHIPLQS